MHPEKSNALRVAHTRHRLPLVRAALATLGIMAAFKASAAIVHYESGTLDQWIPDNTAAGLASTIDVGDVGIVTSVSVQFELRVPANQTGWLGDLYAYLRHDDGFAVLLNRPGRTAMNPFGYGDSQTLDIVFDDSAMNGDIHNYRTAAPLNVAGSLAGPLLGSWAPFTAATRSPPETRMSDALKPPVNIGIPVAYLGKSPQSTFRHENRLPVLRLVWLYFARRR